MRDDVSSLTRCIGGMGLDIPFVLLSAFLPLLSVFPVVYELFLHCVALGMWLAVER